MTREQTIINYLPLVKKCARYVAKRIPVNSVVDYEDLVSVGIIGLMKAIDKYDSKKTKNNNFATYAIPIIKYHILDELREIDHLSKVYRTLAKNIEKAKHDLAQTLFRDPTEHEVASYLKTSVQEYRQLLQPIIHIAIDHVKSKQDNNYIDYFSLSLFSNEASPLELVQRQQLIESIQYALSLLNPRYKQIAHYYYYQDLREREIALKLNICESRVSQILKCVRERVYYYLKEKYEVKKSLSAAA
jgi:RNA polymerase sigma factor for flagellar operon FliA